VGEDLQPKSGQWESGLSRVLRRSQKSRKLVVNVSMEAVDIGEDTGDRKLSYSTCCIELNCS
jgi:hypothetical protein